MFYNWATIGCEQKYAENGKVALIRIDESKDFSRDNCLWIYQDLDKYKYVTLGKDNIEENSYLECISIMNKFCYHCLYELEIAENNSKEKMRDRNRIIYTEITLNDKKIINQGYKPYLYENNHFHKECLLAFLRKTIKDETKVQAVFQQIIEQHNTINRKKGSLTRDEVENAKDSRNAREKLIQYLYRVYDTRLIPQYVTRTIDNLNNGKNNIIISYEKLLDMFMFYEDDLKRIYMNKVKKGNAPPNANQRILYDLTVVVNNIEEYDSKQERKRYMQQDERINGEILDVRKYIRPVQDNSKDEERQKEIERASRFAEEQTKEYDEEDDSYIASLFKDD